MPIRAAAGTSLGQRLLRWQLSRKAPIGTGARRSAGIVLTAYRLVGMLAHESRNHAKLAEDRGSRKAAGRSPFTHSRERLFVDLG
jgi:hypothetical protein